MWDYWQEIVMVGGSSYLLGTFPSGVVVSKVMGLMDPRKGGSGNMGATNMLRVGGRGAGALTLILDMLKGGVAVGLGAYGEGEIGGYLTYTAMLMVILGHCFPVWLRFRGGKGVATYLGCLCVEPVMLILAVGTWFCVAFVFRYSSLAALVSVVVVAVYGYAGEGLQAGLYLSLIGFLIVVRHQENIVRLLKGEESRITLGKKKD